MHVKSTLNQSRGTVVLSFTELLAFGVIQSEHLEMMGLTFVRECPDTTVQLMVRFLPMLAGREVLTCGVTKNREIVTTV